MPEHSHNDAESVVLARCVASGWTLAAAAFGWVYTRDWLQLVRRAPVALRERGKLAGKRT